MAAPYVAKLARVDSADDVHRLIGRSEPQHRTSPKKGRVGRVDTMQFVGAITKESSPI